MEHFELLQAWMNISITQGPDEYQYKYNTGPGFNKALQMTQAELTY